jgi:hypothetical protein
MTMEQLDIRMFDSKICINIPIHIVNIYCTFLLKINFIKFSIYSGLNFD